MHIRHAAPIALSSIALTLALGLVGCSGIQGNYTRQATSAAKEKMAAMKSAMEWQSAKQQLLGGDPEKALQSIDRSLALNPNVAKSHVLKGRILMEQGDLDGSLNWFSSAQALEPENVEAAYYSGVVNERLRQPAVAIANYRRAAELEPSNPQYIVAAAEVLTDQGKLDEAESELNSKQTQFAHNAAVNQTRGHIAALRGNHEAALAYFEEARLAAPDDPAILSDLIASQIALNKFADAELAITRLLKNKDYADRRDLQLMRARCLVQVERAIEARDLLIKLTTSEGGSADAESWIELGKVSFKLKDYNRARTAAARLVAIAPDRPEGYQLRAMVLRRLGSLDQAHENAVRAASIAPNAENHVLLGLIERQLGRSAEARASFAKAIELEPTNTLAANLLAQTQSGAVATVTEEN